MDEDVAFAQDIRPLFSNRDVELDVQVLRPVVL